MNTDINRLKEKLSKFRTEEFVQTIANDFLYRPEQNETLHELTGLDSPVKQMNYLLGLLMATKYEETEIEPKIDGNNGNFEKATVQYNKKIKEIYKDSQKIALKYLDIFFPEDGVEIDSEGQRNRETMLPIFMSYFNQITLCEERQIIERINRWFVSFDEQLNAEYGFTATKLLEFYKYIAEHMQRTIDSIGKPFEDFLAFIENAKDQLPDVDPYSLTPEEHRAILNEIIPPELKEEWHNDIVNNLENAFMSNVDELIEQFGEEFMRNMIAKLGIKRGTIDFQYYTEENPVIKKPLIMISDKKFIVVNSRMFLDAIYSLIYESLEQLKTINFYKHRGEIVEKEVFGYLKEIFGDDAEYYSSVCETPKNDEHDALVKYKDMLFIVEIKSSKVKEPRRNPDQGYKYIKEHYDSKKGIGGGYKQANKLRKFILANDSVTLYNKKEFPFEISKKEFKKIYMLVITSEQFGPLNVNSFSLLKKDEQDPYFWSCDMYNLENLIKVFKYFDKTPKDYIKYINQRIKYHWKFIVFDELDIAEYFLINGDFDTDPNISKAFQIGFFPAKSNIYDKIYFEENGIPYEYCEDDITPMLMISERFNSKIGRNEKCPCGSGKKYKKCHGR